MAIVKMSDPSSVGVWKRAMPFPKNRYTLRCTDEASETSSAGNLMIHRTWEICSPSPVQSVDGTKQLDIDGLKMEQYLPFRIFNDGELDEERTPKVINTLRDDLALLGFEEDSFDDENPPLIAKGKVVDAIVYGKKNASFMEPTPEERAKGQKIGKPIKGPDGKDVVVYQLQIETILGLSTTEVRPY